MAAEQFATLAQTTLNGTVLAGDGSIAVTLPATTGTFPTVPQFRIRIEDEILLVTALAGGTWTVLRGREGTGAAGHANGALVTFVVTAETLAEYAKDLQAAHLAANYY